MTSTPSLTDATLHAAAVKAALNAELSPKQALDYDEVPGLNGNAGVIPDVFVVFSVERRSGAPLRSSATTGRTGWRIAARCVALNVGDCRRAMAKVAAALNEVSLTVDGLATTPVQFESDRAPEWDEDRYSGQALYTYVH